MVTPLHLAAPFFFSSGIRVLVLKYYDILVTDHDCYSSPVENRKRTFSDVIAMAEPSDSDVTTLTSSDVTTLTNVNESYTVLSTVYEDPDTPAAKLMKIRKYQLHTKTYSPKWEQDPNYRGWVQRSKKGDGFYYCLACNQDYTCGKSELDKHASSRKHCMNVMAMPKVTSDSYSVSYATDVSTYEVQNMKNCDPFDNDSSVLNQQDFDASSTSINCQVMALA